MTMDRRCNDRDVHAPHEWIGQALRYDCPGRDEYVVAGTGSRSLRIAEREVQVRAAELVTARLETMQRLRGDDLVVMSGLAEGFDELLAVTALKLRIRLWAALPSRNYGAYYWQRKSVTGMPRLPAFLKLTTAAWKVTYVMEDVHGQRGLYLDGVHANFVRNDFMVDTAAEFLVWEPTSRGTEHCLKAIKRAGKPFEILSLEPICAEELVRPKS